MGGGGTGVRLAGDGTPWDPCDSPVAVTCVREACSPIPRLPQSSPITGARDSAAGGGGTGGKGAGGEGAGGEGALGDGTPWDLAVARGRVLRSPIV